MGIRLTNAIKCSLCANFVDNKCTSEAYEARSLFNTNKDEAAKVCREFITEKIPASGVIANSEAFKFMLAGISEFTIESGKTKTKFRYKLEKKDKNDPTYNTNPHVKSYSKYWLYTYNNGIYEYGGIIYFDSAAKMFKFGKGARGNLNASCDKVKAVIFVLNKFYYQLYNTNVRVYHHAKCGVCGRLLQDKQDGAKGIHLKCMDKLDHEFDNTESVSTVIPDRGIENTVEVPDNESDNSNYSSKDYDLISDAELEAEDDYTYSKRTTRGSEDTPWY